MKKIYFCDPAKVLAYERRRSIGCFSCANSKRELIDGIYTSYCSIKILEPGLNYPDETKESCKYYARLK